MIEAKDLSIGNLVFVYDTGYEKWLPIKIKKENFNYSLKNFKPIPITEEWLLRFGFVDNVIKLNSEWLYLKIELNVQNFDNVLIGDNRNGIRLPYKLEFVHQLQNFYHSLTGEELKIKK